MCDLTQFVVSTIVTNPTSHLLAKLFMEQVVLTFGLVAVVVVDADSKFLNVFRSMIRKLLSRHIFTIRRTNYERFYDEQY